MYPIVWYRDTWLNLEYVFACPILKMNAPTPAPLQRSVKGGGGLISVAKFVVLQREYKEKERENSKRKYKEKILIERIQRGRRERIQRENTNRENTKRKRENIKRKYK